MCARCHGVFCMDCRYASLAKEIKTIGGKYCRHWLCEREEAIEHGLLWVVKAVSARAAGLQPAQPPFVVRL